MNTQLQAPAFDVAGALPRGVTVLEASAGTGKTYAIAALAARYVADGTPLERVLLVTFTRMATGELRERVRERLLSVLHGLDQVLAGVLFVGDHVVELLAEGPEELVLRRRDRLARALANFDAATIATTHGFCQEVLGGLGIAADLEPNVEFVEDLSDLLSEVVDDLYVRRFHGGDEPPFTRAEALKIARIAVENPDAAIAVATGDVPQMRRRLALAVRQELEARKQRLAVMTYDDLLTRLDAALGSSQGAAIAARLRARYDVVLVDEFQDTDPMQWNIMRRAFAEGERALVLIADPKQAIYAFRGADVYAYLDAARAAVTRATLTINWRSDQGLIDAYDALFANSKLGDEGIVYRRVQAADANCARRLHGAPHGAPLRIRVVERDSVDQTARGFAQVSSTREHIARDLAGDAVTLLSAGAEVEIRSEDGTTSRRERIHPGHIAVLVRTNATAALIRQALEEAGIPAVINGAGSVFATDTAREWLRLLEALERPTSIARAHSAALTGFLGWSPEQVALADESEWEQVHERLHDWAKVLRANGVASLLQTITRVEGVAARVLATADGERRLTDLRHIGQLLHAAASTEQLGTTALTGWLRRRIVESERDTADEDRSRRLESDAEAVQVLTVHRSKGLEFPIVYLPFLWEPGHIPDNEPVTFHDAAANNRRVLDVALEGADFTNHRRAIRCRAARRGPPAGVRCADARTPSGDRVVGGLVGQPRLAVGSAAVRARRRRERRDLWHVHPWRCRGGHAVSGGRGGGCRLRERRAIGAWDPVEVEPAAATAGAARGRGVPAHARPALAADLLHRHHRRLVRRRRGKRGRGAGRQRRTRCRRRRAGDLGRRRRGLLSARRDGRRRRGRDGRPPRARGERVRRGGP